MVIPPIISKNLSLGIALLAFILALVLRLFFIDSFRSQSRYMQDIETNVTKALDQLSAEAETVISKVTQADTLTFSYLNTRTRYPYFLYQDDQLVYWSEYRFVPDKDSLQGDYHYAFKALNNGKYVVRKDTLGDYTLFFLLPLQQENRINNRYISSGFTTAIFPQEVAAIQKPSSIDTSHSLVHYQGRALFSVTLNPPALGYREHPSARAFQALVCGLIAISILSVLFRIFQWVRQQVGQQRVGAGLVVLTGSLLLTRFVMLYLDFPVSILPNMLFDGRYYATSTINPSLGDLLLNSLCVLIVVIYLFQHYGKLALYRKLVYTGSRGKSIVAILLLLLAIYALYAHYSFIKTIYFSSQWTLDITESISFPILKIVSLVIFVINTVSYFLFAHILFRVFLNLSRKSYFPVRDNFLIATIIAVLMSLLLEAFHWSIILVSVLYFALLYFFHLPKFLGRLSYVGFLYVFAGAVVSAVAGAIAAYHMKEVSMLDSKQKYANQLLVDNDVFGEYLLYEAAEKIQQDLFIKTRLFNSIASKDIIRQKIQRIYLTDYFDKYDVQVYLYSIQGKPLDNAPASSYKDFKKLVSADQFKTEYNNIYYIDESNRQLSSEEASKRYLTFIDLENYGRTIGHIVIDLTLKRFVPNRVYPELLVDRQYFQSYPGDDYDYAFFSSQGKMIYSSGDEVAFKNLKGYAFDTKVLNEKQLDQDGYHYLIVEGERDEYIAIASKSYSWTDAVSNFSFLFLILVFVLLLVVGLYAVYFAFKAENLNFATKIQLYLSAAFFMPLLAVSLTTLSVISRSYSEEVDRQYLQTAEQISDNMIDLLTSYQNEQINEETLANSLSQISKYAETDANLFDIEGKLIASSQPSIYTNELLSGYINPVAYANIKEQDNNKLVLDESVGKLSYKSSYIGLKSYKSGKLIGILSLPFFESGNEFRGQIIQVLTNIMSIFTFVFIAFLIISYLASMLLTYPLRYITQKIRKTSLSDYNEPLSWESNDEIGLMIGEYNRMLVNLEASKAALSRNEKETAWREMAKQVAHEIKNPLTPMRLSLQLLQRKLKQDFNAGMDAGAVQEVSKPIDNMLHQVDTLNDIASSFSNFAQMPLPKSEPYELCTIVRRTVGLFDGESDRIDLEMEDNVRYFVIGDKQLTGRILSNLIINAKQSIPKDRQPNIRIALQKAGIDKVIIKVSDNGTGIAREIQHKVFLPNFSTKYAGSGIGLAIAKRGIEHAGGRIAFDTKEGVGTTFFIELPLILDKMPVMEEKN